MALWPLARILAGKELRRRWRGLVLLGLLVALWVGATMTAVAGARRTSSVVDRFQRVTSASDAQFAVSGDRDGDDLLRALEASPEVDEVDSMWFASTGLAFDEGRWVVLFGGARGSWGRDFDHPIVVDGRTADPASETEVVVTASTADLLDVGVGDHLDIPTWDRADLEAWWLVRGSYPDFDGPLINVVIVGVVEMAKSLESPSEEGLFIVATPAFLERWSSSIGREQRHVVASFSDDGVDAAALAERLSTQVGATVRAVTTEQAYAGNLRDATNALTAGLVVLAILVGAVGAVVVGLGVAREVRSTAVRFQPLLALGATAAQRVMVFSIPIAAVGFVAAIIASVASALASTLFPLGPGHAAEPLRGLWIDAPVVGSSLFAVLFMLAISAVSTIRPVSTTSARSVSKATKAPFQHFFGPATRVGYRNAVSSSQAQATLVIATVTLAGFVGAAWFTQGLDDLGSDQRRWGYTWSSSPEAALAADQFNAAVDAVQKHPEVASVGYLDTAVVVIAGVSVPISSFAMANGALIYPEVLSGRLPTSSFDIAIGERTARELRLDIGDSVQLDSGFATPSEFTVVGLIVPPFTGTDAEPGVGVLTTAPSLQRLSYPFDSLTRNLLMVYRSGADVQAVEADLTDLGFRFEVRSHSRPPRGLANVLGVSVISVGLGAFFLVLGALASLLVAVRQRTRHSRDFAILRSLGFDRRDIGHCVLAEATTIVVVGLLVGVPLGLFAGNRAWRLTVGDLGIVDTQPSPVLIVLSTLGLGVAAALGAAFVGHRVLSRVVAGRELSFRPPES